jgi:hypothetical protein
MSDTDTEILPGIAEEPPDNEDLPGARPRPATATDGSITATSVTAS